MTTTLQFAAHCGLNTMTGGTPRDHNSAIGEVPPVPIVCGLIRPPWTESEVTIYGCVTMRSKRVSEPVAVAFNTMTLPFRSPAPKFTA